MAAQGQAPQPMMAANPRISAAGSGLDPILNRPSTNEIPTRPAVRPMGGFTPFDDRRDIMDPRAGGRGYNGGGINPGGMYGPNRGPRSYQPGHGNGNGMAPGDVRTKGVQNASMDGGQMQGGDPGGMDALRVKRKYERGMMGDAPPEDYSSI